MEENGVAVAVKGQGQCIRDSCKKGFGKGIGDVLLTRMVTGKIFGVKIADHFQNGDFKNKPTILNPVTHFSPFSRDPSPLNQIRFIR